MRYASARAAGLTVVLLGAVVLAVCSGPVLAAPVQQTPDGDVIVKSAQPITAAKSVSVRSSALNRHLKAETKQFRRKIIRYRQDAEWWARVMGTTLRSVHRRHLSAAGPAGLRQQAIRWKRTAKLMRLRAQHPPHLADWLCIHRYEGSWTDTGAPYWGGLQMNLGFQRSYGGWLYRTKGTANHWTPLEQMWVAEKALKTRGFGPWPNTARDCGLM